MNLQTWPALRNAVADMLERVRRQHVIIHRLQLFGASRLSSETPEQLEQALIGCLETARGRLDGVAAALERAEPDSVLAAMYFGFCSPPHV
jgi:hypothetical protein